MIPKAAALSGWRCAIGVVLAACSVCEDLSVDVGVVEERRVGGGEDVLDDVPFGSCVAGGRDDLGPPFDAGSRFVLADDEMPGALFELVAAGSAPWAKVAVSER